MKIYVSRHSVSAGDDVDAPHSRRFSLPDDLGIEQVICHVVGSGYLPSIAGGRASWSVVSNVPLAVVAQEWPEPRLLPMLEGRADKLDIRQGMLRLYFNYHAQLDPEIVYRVFHGLRLDAI